MTTTLLAPAGIRQRVTTMTERDALEALQRLAASDPQPLTPDTKALQAFLFDLSYTEAVEDTVRRHATRYATARGTDPDTTTAALGSLLVALATFVAQSTRAGGLGRRDLVTVDAAGRYRTGTTGRKAVADPRSIRLLQDASLPLPAPPSADPDLSWAAAVLLPNPARDELLVRFLQRETTSALPDLTIDTLWRVAAICTANRPGALVTVCQLTEPAGAHAAHVHHVALRLLDHHRRVAADAVTELVRTRADRDADDATLRQAVDDVVVNASVLGHARMVRAAAKLDIVDQISDDSRASKALRRLVDDLIGGIVTDERQARSSDGTGRWLPEAVGQLSAAQVAAIGRLHGLTEESMSDRTRERDLAARAATLLDTGRRSLIRHHVTVAVRHDLDEVLLDACRRMVDEPSGWDRDFVAAHREKVAALLP